MVGTFKFDMIGYDALGNRVAGPSRSLSIVDGARDFTTKVGPDRYCPPRHQYAA